MEAQRAKLPPWAFFDAIDGLEMGVRSFFAKPAVHAAAGRGGAFKVIDRGAMGAGESGCYLSHVALLRTVDAVVRMSGDSDSLVAVFEDDVVFVENFMERLEAFLGAVPDDWDMIHFSQHHTKPPTSVADGVVRIHGAWGTFGYMVKPKACAALVAAAQRLHRPIDAVFEDVMPSLHCYGPSDRLVSVAPEFNSDVGDPTRAVSKSVAAAPVSRRVAPSAPTDGGVVNEPRHISKSEMRAATLSGLSRSGRVR